MDKTLNKIALSIWVVVTLVLLAVAYQAKQERPAPGSVMPGGEYIATTTVGMGATHNKIRGSLTTLGSIIVASSSATTFKIWNATSTTDIASTSIGTLKASIAEGTYTFDVELPRGLVVETPAGFNGNYTITWRAQ